MVQKIIITGSNGLLGQKLVNLISSDPEFSLIAVSKGKNRSVIRENYIYEDVDITNKSAIDSLINKYCPDIIIHTAAMTNVDACETEKEGCISLNVNSIAFLIEAIQKIRDNNKNYNPHFIHLSTDFIFDGTQGPLTEEAQPNPLSFYAHSKLEAEKILMSSDIFWSIARTVLVYGVTPNMSRSNIVLWVKKSLEEGKKINVVDDQYRTPTLAEDLATGCLLIAKKRAQGIFNISGEEFMNIYDMALRIAKFWGLEQKLISRSKSDTIKQPAKRPPVTGFIIDKAKELLGYKPHTLEEGLGLLEKQMSELKTN